MDFRQSRQAAALMLLAVLLVLWATLAGVLNDSLYAEAVAAGTISEFLRVGSVAQDMVSIVLGILLVALCLAFLRRPGPKIFILMLGLTGYFFYGYGLYAMQGQYTALFRCTWPFLACRFTASSGA